MFLGLSWYFILMDFYLYSFFGWIYECSFCSLKEHKVINRGFLVGPLLPLYGFGGTIVYVFLRPLEPHPSLLYLGGMLLATAIEYFTSWGMEKLFHAGVDAIITNYPDRAVKIRDEFLKQQR